MVKKEKKARDFAKCIEVEEKVIELPPDEQKEDPSYEGPKLDTIEDCTPDWCVKLMDWLKDQKKLDPRSFALILNHT